MPSASIRAMQRAPSQFDRSVHHIITHFPKNLRVPSMLLVDDSRTFCTRMQKVAQHEHIPLISVANPSELANLAPEDFSCAIVDHRADGLDGFAVAELIADLYGEIPSIIIAESPVLLAEKEWPATVRDVIAKSLGPYAIFNCILETYEWAILRQEVGAWSH